MKQYPCELKVGDTFKTKDGRVWHIAEYDGKYIYTVEGAQYVPKHPDIIGFFDAEEQEVKKKASRSSRKKSQYTEEYSESEFQTTEEEETTEVEE